MRLAFLKDITIQEVANTTPRTAKRESNPPSGLTIRVWSDGSVYPSAELVSRFSLEYPKAKVSVFEAKNDDGTAKLDDSGAPVTKRTIEVDHSVPSFGFDVFTLNKWTQVANVPEDVIVVGVTPRSESRIDLFDRCKFQDNGQPVSSVMDQGANTFGKNFLLPMLLEVYKMSPADHVNGYIDLEVETSINLADRVPNGIFMLPKVVTKGENKGKADYVRREGISIFPLVPVGYTEQEDVPDAQAGTAIPVPTEQATNALPFETEAVPTQPGS